MADYQTIRTAGATAGVAIDEGLRAHMNKVYGLMSVAMVLTALAAWAVSGLAVTTDPSLAVAQLGHGVYLNSVGSALYLSPLRWVVIFAPLAMVFAFGAVIQRFSVGAAQLFFYVYAALIGLSLSSIFLVYTQTSIATTFLATAVAFGGLSLYGYTTKRDLSPIASFLMMGLIGLIVVSVINIFLHSTGLAFVVSVAGILIFAGLTAWDTQSIKNDYVQHARGGDSDWMGKAAIMGALRLYLDFINMFMYLLQFMGDRR